jgi:hypothetical protein
MRTAYSLMGNADVKISWGNRHVLCVAVEEQLLK